MKSSRTMDATTLHHNIIDSDLIDARPGYYTRIIHVHDRGRHMAEIEYLRDRVNVWSDRKWFCTWLAESLELPFTLEKNRGFWLLKIPRQPPYDWPERDDRERGGVYGATIVFDDNDKVLSVLPYGVVVLDDDGQELEVIQ